MSSGAADAPTVEAATARRDLSPSDRDFVRRLGRGDSEALAEVMRQHVNALTRFAFSMLRSHDAADDVVQHAFVQLWERRAELPIDCQLKSYLFRSVHNRIVDEQRSHGTHERYRRTVLQSAESGSVVASVPSHEGRILASETVQAGMARLGERRQVALRLRLREELSHSEIAQVLGVTAEAAQRLVARAIADLREILRESV